jgi:iron complex transport system substrate-binding protein
MPRPAQVAGALVTAIVVLAAGGCGFKSEPTGALNGAPVTVTDSAAATVSVQTVPTRIVSLDEGMTELLFAVGAGSSVVGRSSGPAYPAAATRVRVIPTGNVGAIARLHPDLVIAQPGEAGAIHRAMKVPVYTVDGTKVSAAWQDQLNVSLLAGRGPEGRAIVIAGTRRLDHLAAVLSSHPVAKVYLDQGAYVPPPLMAQSLIAAAHGDAVTVASPAELQHVAPDVWLSELGSGTPPKEVRTDPSTRNLPAVKTNRVRVIPPWWVETDGPRMPVAVAHLGAIFHPGATAGG